jgi:hypothetical protein
MSSGAPVENTASVNTNYARNALKYRVKEKHLNHEKNYCVELPYMFFPRLHSYIKNSYQPNNIEHLSRVDPELFGKSFDY